MKDLKPIPQEFPSCGPAKQIAEETKESLMEIIKQKLGLKEIEREEKIIGKTCMRFVKFAAQKDSMSFEEIEDLIGGMERSILFIQRKKKNILEKRNKKLNMLAIKRAKHGNSGNKHGGIKNKHSANRKKSKR